MSLKMVDYIARIQTYITNEGIKNNDQKIEAFKASMIQIRARLEYLSTAAPLQVRLKNMTHT